MSTATTMRGGEWLLGDVPATSIFTREQLSEEHRLVGRTAAEFVAQEVTPALPALERKDWAQARALVGRAGDLGLIGTDVPERLGGVGLDKVAAIVVGEAIGPSASFATTFGAQTGLAIIPILCFGTEAQQQKYLPRIVSGEIVGAYCLSESGSGSDALGARARATRADDGSWRLSGEKLWITNGGFADVFVVFAKIDGEAFTAFIVERHFGVVSGREEHKMGLHGSSTTPLILQDVPVPAANVLGEVGRGHKLAFSVLNLGRLKLGAMCAGGCRIAIGESARYAAARHQFGQPIAAFGAIRHKLGEMTAQAYALESVLYRTAGLIDQLTGEHATPRLPLAVALQELAIETSIAKVLGSETLDFVLDENVQIHGANGYVRDYAAERHYRDARVNRIFEGTNEINRLVVSGMLTKRAVKGELALIPAARRLLDEIMGPPSFTAGSSNDDPLASAAETVAAFKKVAVLTLGATMERFGTGLPDQQEVLLWVADLMIDPYAAESTLARAAVATAIDPSIARLHHAAARTFINDAALRVETTARQILAALAEGDTLRTHLAALRRVLKVTPTDTVRWRRALAEATVERGGYLF